MATTSIRSTARLIDRDVAFRVGVFAPGDDRAVGPQRQRVISAGRNRDHVAQADGLVGLPETVVAPYRHGAIGRSATLCHVPAAML